MDEPGPPARADRAMTAAGWARRDFPTCRHPLMTNAVPVPFAAIPASRLCRRDSSDFLPTKPACRSNLHRYELRSYVLQVRHSCGEAPGQPDELPRTRPSRQGRKDRDGRQVRLTGVCRHRRMCRHRVANSGQRLSVSRLGGAKVEAARSLACGLEQVGLPLPPAPRTL